MPKADEGTGDRFDESGGAANIGERHLFQRPAPAPKADAAKGHTGPGCHGTPSGNTETFVLPALTCTTPDGPAPVAVRASTLPLAMQRAAQLGLEGAAFQWRTIGGEECSSYWPAGRAGDWFRGMSHTEDALSFRPRLPNGLTHLLSQR